VSTGSDGTLVPADAALMIVGLFTAEWIETETGEVSRAPVAPAQRESVRRFLGRFRGREL
jgi:hypothetical protein